MATNQLTQTAIEITGGGSPNGQLTQIAVEIIGKSSCPSPISIVGGPFLDSKGNPVSNGKLLLVLSGNASTIAGGCSSVQLASGFTVPIFLDNNGVVVAGQSIWGTDSLVPSNLKYSVMLFDVYGRKVWTKPQFQTLVGFSSFNVSSWIPN